MEHEIIVRKVDDYGSEKLNEAKQQRLVFYNSPKEDASRAKNYQ
jgi:hypothetical protein